jgi:DNA-binding LytR/AlgR family response regulator
MILKAYRDARFQYVKARDFAAFRADSKYVTGITPDSLEWLLPDGTTLKSLEAVLPDLVRINRGVLVKSRHLTQLIRTRVGGSIAITVVTTVGEFKLARRNCVKSIKEQIELNIGSDDSYTYAPESPDET